MFDGKLQSIQLKYMSSPKYYPLEKSEIDTLDLDGASEIYGGEKSNSSNNAEQVWLEDSDKHNHKKPSKDFSPIISKSFGTALQHPKYSCTMFFLRIYYYFRYKLFTHSISQEHRTIYFNGYTEPYFFPVVLAQLYPPIHVGPLYTYIAPLSFVLLLCILKESVSHVKKWRKDRELNSSYYDVFNRNLSTIQKKKACNICVGDLVQLHTNERAPCDLILLHATQNGITFVRTDQLDGETDWKLRRAVSHTQSLGVSQLDLMNAWVQVEPPRRNIYEFQGTFYWNSKRQPQCQFEPQIGLNKSSRNFQKKSDYEFNDATNDFYVSAEPLVLENTIWASTTITSGPVVGLAIYTGVDTRSSWSSISQKTKTALFDTELNLITKFMFAILATASFILAYFAQNEEKYVINMIRYVLILSSIIPISLRVNMDLARIYYGLTVVNDKKLANASVRNTAIAEDLGRIDILLTDKTGTLTRNEMVFKKLNLGTICYGQDNLDEIKRRIQLVFSNMYSSPTSIQNQTDSNLHFNQFRRVMLGLALCHTVLPTMEEGQSEISFQASSPDEIAMTTFARQVGLRLIKADEQLIRLELWNGVYLDFEVCYRFPFSSETKRMGCIVRHVPAPGQKHPPLNKEAYKYLLFVKGAEQAVSLCLQSSAFQWLEEECDNLGRSGLRTMVFACKELSKEEFTEFQQIYHSAQTSLTRRNEKVSTAISNLLTNLTLLGVTGVEDTLQEDVFLTIESFRRGGISVWMVTGDKLETALCIALSAGLKSVQQSIEIFTYKRYPNPNKAKIALKSLLSIRSHIMIVVDGEFVEMAFKYFKSDFIKQMCSCSAVVFARCTPIQKSEIVMALKTHTNKRIAAVGDGGNDVSMIKKADCGIGIFGKEGNQAAYNADYAVTEFKDILRLFFWHGRLFYIRSSKLAQFVIHRGLSISVVQVLYCSFNQFKPIATFQGWLTVGYATYYTMLPVFSLVLSRDLSEETIFAYPELYNELRDNKALTLKVLLWWLFVSIYQAFAIVYGAVYIFDFPVRDTVSVTFTSLILSELLNIGLEISKWHPLMLLAEFCSVLIYILSIFLLPSYFDLNVIFTWSFWGKAGALTLLSFVPVYLLLSCLKFFYPTRDSKLTFN